MRALCFATGNLWRLIGKKDIFEIISSLDIDGVEYTYGKHYEERKPSEKDLGTLRSYKYVSIHSPFRLSLDLMPKENFNSIINLIALDYKKMNAQHIVFHPNSVLPTNLPKMSFVTENLNPKKGKNRPRDGFEKMLEEKTDWGLCLDASHAYDWGAEETERIVKKWKHRIKAVHFSNNRYHKDHSPCLKVSRAFLKSIEPLQDLSVPFVIEEDMPFSSVEEIREEINRVRNILGF